ncbi:penicillin acylase family protein [Peribacillus frigoritolerans]|uniref:penicillin acylase family protein n=1 Tax=Peribacillus frigoritolerans TaxID=450367 RepID=UPI001059D2EA|nr:penicillin acylase family protein [Peribacillus frigoritolerans]TDL80690.1 penicillin acylase family protein [Peribacillus frigoritolerans]
MEAKAERRLVPRRRRGIWIGAFAILFLLIGVFIYVNLFTEKSLPQLNGEVNVRGLTDAAQVTRDKNGVPHIMAQSDKDLYIAQGYVQAQDRLFQMDLSRRQASGMLSEVVGEATVEKDKFFRTLGLRRAAEASYPEYDESSKDAMQWFADGVNAFMKDAKEQGTLPLEFSLLNYEPAEWTPIDSLTIGKYMAFDLGGHWSGQAFRYWALDTFPKEKAYDLFPSYPKDAPEILSAYEEVNMNMEKSFASAIIPPEFNGSNNWVVSGEKSESGKPLLADDPHLSLATPSIWYQMHLQSGSMNVSGVIFAGVPGIILGHNDYIAWGVTNTGPDVQDLYIEKRNPDNPRQFLYNDKWEDAKVFKEPIAVKDEKIIDYEVIETRHGPIMSEFAFDKKQDTALAMKWTALMPSTEFQAVLSMNKAKDWDEFEQALEDFHVPTQNFVFAGADGTIAYKANGKIPIRKKGDGMIPVPGWTDEYEWEGFIPYDELPRAVNPEEGFVATANNKVIDDSYPYHISHHWAQPYRYMRIKEVLETEDKLTLNDMKKLQMDQRNLYAEEFLPAILKRISAADLNESEKASAKLLAKWNMEDDKEMGAPLLFHLLMKEIPVTLFEDAVPKEMDALFEGKQGIVDELLRRAFNGNESEWISDKGGLDKVLLISFGNVVASLQEEYGDNPEDWKWGDYHQLYFGHPLSSASPVLKWLFNNEKPQPVGGSQITVAAANYNPEGIVNHGASWRFVIDAADMTKGHHIVGPGQSGHVKSDWYQDQIADWMNGTYHLTDLDAVQKEESLTLLPEK